MGGRYPGPMALTGTMWLISTLGWPTTNHSAKLDFKGCKILTQRKVAKYFSKYSRLLVMLSTREYWDD